MDKTTELDLNKLEAKARNGEYITRAEQLELIALARAGTAAPAGQQAEPVAWHMRREKWNCNFVVTDAAERDMHLSRGCIVLREYFDRAPVSAAPAAAAQPSLPEGFAIVPIEPTPQMLWSAQAGVGNWAWDNSQATITDEEAREVWSQMVAAHMAAATPEQSDTTKGQA